MSKDSSHSLLWVSGVVISATHVPTDAITHCSTFSVVVAVWESHGAYGCCRGIVAVA